MIDTRSLPDHELHQVAQGLWSGGWRHKKALAALEELHRRIQLPGTFRRDPAQPGKWYYTSPNSNIYTLLVRDGIPVCCDCPDATVGRSARLRQPCKHRRALGERLLAEAVKPPERDEVWPW